MRKFISIFFFPALAWGFAVYLFWGTGIAGYCRPCSAIPDGTGYVFKEKLTRTVKQWR